MDVHSRRQAAAIVLTCATAVAVVFLAAYFTTALELADEARLRLELPLDLAFSWPWYVAEVVPGLQPDPWSVAIAVASLGALFFGGHAFFHWLYAATDPAPGPAPRRWKWRWTAKLMGGVLLLFAAGIAMTGVVHQSLWLAAAPAQTGVKK